MHELVGLLLAAGFSRRYGAQKLLEPISGGNGMAEESCRHLREATDRVIAVVRPDQDVLANILKKAGAEVTLFDEAPLGMGATLAFGVKSSPESMGWLIALADMPLIKVSTIRVLSETLRSGASLVMPSYRGQRGHPVGFHNKHYEALARLHGDQGARSIIADQTDSSTIVPVDDAGILYDIDTPADLVRCPTATRP